MATPNGGKAPAASTRWAPPLRMKAADFAAEALRRRILVERLGPGERIGSQDDVIDEMGISRPSAREALLLLHHQGLVESRPGPGGGVYVTEPRSGPAVDAASHYLQFHGIDADSVRAARTVIEPPLAAAAATVRERGHATLFRDCLAREAALLSDPLTGTNAYLDQAQEFHSLIAEIATPSPFSLFAAVLFDLSRPLAGDLPYEPAFLAANHRSHEKIAEAILAGLPDLALNRMRRHMRAVLSSVPGAS